MNDAPLADRAPGDASACAAVAYRRPKPGLASSVIASAVFGYPGAEAVGHSLDLIIPEQFRARHWEGFGKVMQTGVTRYGAALLAMPAVRKDGVRISVEFSVTLIRDPVGEVLGVAAIMRDVTQRWSQQKQMRQRLADLAAQVVAPRRD